MGERFGRLIDNRAYARRCLFVCGFSSRSEVIDTMLQNLSAELEQLGERFRAKARVGFRVARLVICSSQHRKARVYLIASTTQNIMARV